MSGGVPYVYGVTDAFRHSLAVAGLHGMPLRVVASGSVMAIYSEHAHAPEPDEDLLWAHERVVEELMEGATILPMRFGSTVAGPEALVATLERRQEEFVAALERVRGAVELSVRAQLPCPAGPAAAEPRLAAPGQVGPGTAYLLERARRQRRGEEAAELVHRPLTALARSSVPKVGGADPHTFKASYLVDRGMVGSFGERVGELDASLGEIRVSCTGPWPPYSFVAEDPG